MRELINQKRKQEVTIKETDRYNRIWKGNFSKYMEFIIKKGIFKATC